MDGGRPNSEAILRAPAQKVFGEAMNACSRGGPRHWMGRYQK